MVSVQLVFLMIMPLTIVCQCEHLGYLQCLAVSVSYYNPWIHFKNPSFIIQLKSHFNGLITVTFSDYLKNYDFMEVRINVDGY